MQTTQLDLTADTIDVRDIIARYEELEDAVVAETMRLLAQPNSINLPEDVRLSMAVVMAYERVSLMGSEELDAIIQAQVGENA